MKKIALIIVLSSAFVACDRPATREDVEQIRSELAKMGSTEATKNEAKSPGPWQIVNAAQTVFLLNSESGKTFEKRTDAEGKPVWVEVARQTRRLTKEEAEKLLSEPEASR